MTLTTTETTLQSARERLVALGAAPPFRSDIDGALALAADLERAS